MPTYYHTNIDFYRDKLPRVASVIPRIGETVRLSIANQEICILKKMPIRLEVVAVEYDENNAHVELWFRQTDVKSAENQNRNLLNTR